MKFWRVAALMGILADLLSCAHGPDPCIGSYEARLTMPCTCPATLDQACAPWPNDDTNRSDGGSL